ncbi:hypothetical protein ACWYXD_19855 [Enterobacter roggenkampii]|uniref:hypothetical protein n=1 Tax=Enterobacter asburiae TaxID=61645 RepID=UPI001E50932A|nr:hypothetical protein [Enterobacter asburiae]MCE2003916.1 hypothetical protein [Enterobacter asburiae]HCM9246546.1 hypothetical protein [Enterobacter bugandensis]
MLILDCSSRTQALHTLSAGFACPPEKLKKVLLSLDLEHIYETDQSIMVDANQYLKDYVSAELGEPGPFSRAFWFHGTRTFAGNSFPDGLLALNQSESLAMKMLLDLAPDEVVRKRLREWDQPGGVPDEMFQLRTGDKMHWGPYGHLVRELHFHTSENGLHDYLWLPELVEDVCKAYQKKYGHDLKPHYLSVLHPCIVWFEADIVYEKGVLETALAYAYTSVRDLPPDGNATFGIDCDGKSVSRSDIAKIEFLPPGQI